MNTCILAATDWRIRYRSALRPVRSVRHRPQTRGEGFGEEIAGGTGGYPAIRGAPDLPQWGKAGASARRGRASAQKQGYCGSEADRPASPQVQRGVRYRRVLHGGSIIRNFAANMLTASVRLTSPYRLRTKPTHRDEGIRHE